jgi:iron complex transport system substrate-binding protein
MRLTIILLAAAAMAAIGCKKPLPRPDAPHPRIVAYSPALTETLLYAGLGDHIVGIESHSPLPPGPKPAIVGDALAPSAEAIVAAAPDILLIQSLPSQFDAVRAMNPAIRIEHFRIETVPGVAAALQRVGELAGNPSAGIDARGRFEARVAAVADRVQGKPRPKVAFVMDHRNPFTGGEGTFLDEIVTLAGGQNVFADLKGWQSVTAELIVARRPDVVVCQSSVGDAAEAARYFERLGDLPAARTGGVFIVTESGWTVPSPRIADYLERLAAMIHPPASQPSSREASK